MRQNLREESVRFGLCLVATQFIEPFFRLRMRLGFIFRLLDNRIFPN
jgi:hypothetical protein